MAYDGYIRVSRVGGREGDSFQSPEEQRNSIEGWAQSRGTHIAAWHEDFDVSGGTLKRPGLDAVVQRIKAGETEGVVVAKLNRFSRAGVGSALALFEEIYSAGGEVVAVDVGIDPTTPVGKFARTIMLALNEMELDRFKESWSSARRKAVERGVYVGKTPLGYERNDDGTLKPNEDAPKIAALFEVAMLSMDDALEFARSTWPARYWSMGYLHQLLARRVYLGEAKSGEFIGTVPALVDVYTFDAAQHPNGKTRSANRSYPLSGIARCAACNGPLVGHLGGRPKNRRRAYRCTNKDCPERIHLFAEPLESFTYTWIKQNWHPIKVTGKDMQKAVQAVDKASQRFQRFLGDDDLRDRIGEDAWRVGIDERQQKLIEAQEARDQIMAEARSLSSLNEETPASQRRLAEQAIGELLVKRGSSPLSERVEIKLSK